MEELTKQQITSLIQQWKAEQTKAELATLRERQRVQFTKLYGSYLAGDYAIGDTIRFRLRRDPPGDEKSGVVLWSYGPGRTPVSGTPHPTVYVVDAGRGMPLLVYSGEIVQAQE